MANETVQVSKAVVSGLADFFRRNGYVRKQDPKRLKKEGYSEYKKGDEVRLIAETKSELAEIRRLLKAAGFTPSKPFEKTNQFAQPIYGRDAVARFLKLVKVKPATTKKPAKSAAKR